MKSVMAVGLFSLMFHSVGSLAANAEPLTVVKSIEIHADASKVWLTVSKFGDLGAWHPAVAKTELVSGSEGQVGAKRSLTLQDGGKINETLTQFDAAKHQYQYVINDGVLPVKDYVSSVRVMTNGAGSSIVVWESHFLPNASGNDKLASDTIKAVYEAGLNQLKKIQE